MSSRITTATVSSSRSEDVADLLSAARETKRRIQWDRILRDSKMQWKWLENARAFSIYTNKRMDNGAVWGVLAIGVVKGSVDEVRAILASSSRRGFEWQMAAIHEKEFKQGDVLRETVEINNAWAPDQPVTVSARSATFATAGWLHSDTKWEFVEATAFDIKTQTFDKQLTTFSTNPDKTKRKFRQAKPLQGLICGYHVEPNLQDDENDPAFSATLTSRGHSVTSGASPRKGATRVHFYGQVNPTTEGHKARTLQSSEVKTAEHRLLQFARSCGRLSVLIRRKRLGMQVLVDQRCVSPSKKPVCFHCGQRQLVHRPCHLCGQGSCDDCAASHERERRDRHGHLTIDFVRVCDPCLARVENANYSIAAHADTTETAVRPDPPSVKPRSASTDLKDLLRDALLDGPSARKPSVMKVIRYVLDQEQEEEIAKTPTGVPPRKTSVVLTPVSAEQEYVQALNNVQVETIPHTAAELAQAEGRTYLVTPEKDVEKPMPYPVPSNEAQREQLINDIGVLKNGPYEELNIICDMAAKELNTFASIVTVTIGGEQVVIGANRPELEHRRQAREDSFCQHAVMSTKPLIVPHPEADIRFSGISYTKAIGSRFYAGFPLLGGDANDTVIGTLCCVDFQSHQITESQYSAMKKLSQTASKVIRVQAQRRRQSSGPRAA